MDKTVTDALDKQMSENGNITLKKEVDYTPFINPDIVNDLEVDFKFRGLVEMSNDLTGDASIRRRIQRMFDSDEISIQLKNIKKAGKYFAKAIMVGNIDKNLILSWAPFINNPVVVHGSTVQVECKDSDNFKSFENITINTLKFLVSTPTLTADIDIIPMFEMQTEVLIANKELIESHLNNLTGAYSTFVDAIHKAQFKKNSMNDFVGILGAAINEDSQHHDMFEYLDKTLETDELKTVAKVYFALKN